jgi:aspartate/methionine/tyrosine aminotransferase
MVAKFRFSHAVIDQGDEVLLFDPAYETYETCIELARGVPVSFCIFVSNPELDFLARYMIQRA